MAVAVSFRETKAVKALPPQTRLTMTFRELIINGKKSWKHCWLFARYAADSGDADMVKVIECYDGLKKRERESASPEYVCELAGVDSNDFAAVVFREYLSFSGDAANLIEAASRPAVVRKSVQFAKTPEGHRDRKMLFEHSGFLPPKTGGGIHVNASANAENQSATVISAPELPSMESDTLRFTRVLKGDAAKVIEASETPATAPARVAALTGSAEERNAHE
jgi:hypothetical protein